jgi:dihydropteroate synthase
MRGTPQTMQSLARYADPALEVTLELADRLQAALAAGIEREKICLDPGIGFAKGATQSRAIIARLPLLLSLGCPVLLGVSRKSMIGHLAGAETPATRLPGSLAAALYGLERGASILRVHDVAETVQAVRVWQAMTE